ncbi:unnamed protein product [Paramecium sonneborni]|uniref:Protein kinase domain-containing protein n=1 Tax=Paramecium sonneborni TaxID=65129 RepID=A0A8S1JZJ4_9CILI|nr:unnamed protein product [Paramecium sonneborni]
MQSQFLEEYKVIQQMLASQYSNIYQVNNIKDKQNYTLKISQKQYSSLVLHEKEILKDLNFPEIIKFVDLKQDEQYSYIIFEHCEQTLEQFWNQNAKKFSENMALNIFIQILNGLEILSNKEIVHADLSMKNIFMKQFHIKIANFECSHLNKRFLIKLQSYGYAAPELYSPAHLTSKSDIFSLGCILFAMIFGYYPFNQESGELKQAQLQMDESIKNSISPFIIKLIYEMVQYNPNQRPDIQEIKKILESNKNSVFQSENNTNILQPQQDPQLWGIVHKKIFETENFTEAYLQNVFDNIMYFYQVAENFGGKKFFNWKKTMFPRFMLYKRSYCELINFSKEVREKCQLETIKKQLEKYDKTIKRLKQVLDQILLMLQNQKEYNYPISQWELELNTNETQQFFNSYHKAIQFLIDYFKKSQIPYSKQQQNGQQNLKDMLILFINVQVCQTMNPYHQNQQIQTDLQDKSIEYLLNKSGF